MSSSPHTVNETVWVRLTSEGRAALEKHNEASREVLLRGFSSAEISGYGEKVNAEGWWTGELFTLMSIFGSEFILGGPLLFERGEIHFTQPF